MLKNRMIVLILAFFILCVYAVPAYGFITPSIKIDGKARHFVPPPVIKNDRTMVPLRFVIEDEALNGKVYWDGALQKVALDCRGKYIELFIGNNKATVDGTPVYFDAPPYIYQDRTYVPLRFLAESLGAVVKWDNFNRTVSIDFNYRPEVLAYYYYTPRSELENNIHLFTDIAFRWFETDGGGHLTYEYNDDYERVLNYAGRNEVRTHASVVLMKKDELHKLLSSPENRGRLIGNLLDVVKKDNYDGVNIDFEFIAPEDAGYFTLFLQELKTSLGPGKTLSVAVFARTGKEKWANGYQYDKIGQIADRVVVMAYDYSYRSSSPGPVAPLWWVKEVSDYMVKNIPREKILLGMPTYGYDWPSGATAATVTEAKLKAIKARYQVSEHFDNNSMSPYYTYMDSSGIYHQVWLENEKSLAEKMNVVENQRLGGVSFWRIGNGFDDLYRVLEKTIVR